MNRIAMKHILLAALCVFLLKNLESEAKGKKSAFKLFCYVQGKAFKGDGKEKISFKDIEPTLCTHLLYSFATIKDNRIFPRDPDFALEENGGKGGYKQFNAIKEKNPNLKTLISVGGYSEGSVPFSKMARNESTRETFVHSIQTFLKKHNFDGVDIDWEYPTRRDGLPEDRRNFVLLLKELNAALKPQGHLLTAALASKQYDIDPAYDIPQVNQYLDYLSIMTYDFHEGLGQHTGNNAALFSGPHKSPVARKLNADFAIRYWLRTGASANKMLLGTPGQGRTLTLENPRYHGLGANVTGEGPAGPLLQQKGILAYNEICLEVKPENGWTTVFEETQKVPYAYKGTDWLSFDNPESMKDKAKYIRTMGLAGGMIFAVDLDDFRGWCSNGKYPLINALKSGLSS